MEVKKIATRDSYGAALAELGAEHDDLIVFDADLAGATKTGTFKKAFPERHFNCGIAEGDDLCRGHRKYGGTGAFPRDQRREAGLYHRERAGSVRWKYPLPGALQNENNLKIHRI